MNDHERTGKYIQIRNKSTFYLVESQGHFVKTFLDSIQENLREVDKLNETKTRLGSRKNLTKEEEIALKNLTKNGDIVIKAADKGEG